MKDRIISDSLTNPVLANQNTWIGITIGVFVLGFFIGGSVFAIFSTTVHESPAPVETVMLNQGVMEAEQLALEHLKTFDELDFEVFTKQQWERLHESHSQDVIVHWPDGRITEGIEPHIEDLKAMFVYAPDTRIQQHPVKIASGEWTSVIGIIEGTFTEPMPLPDGTTIPPTGKSFKLTMVTVGHWKNGVMDEEYLFWDNLEFMKQIGLA